MTGGTPGTRAAKQATATITIVMAVSSDAVATGLIASLARPGGNITGTTYFDPELHAKRLELLKEAVPRVTRVGVLINPDNPQTMGTTLQYIRVAAESLKLKLSIFEARSPNELEHIFSAMAESRVDAMAMADDGMFLANLRTIADIAAKKRLPSTGAKELAEAGGLIGYGVNFVQTYHRAAYFVDRILKGTKPGDLPVEQPQGLNSSSTSRLRRCSVSRSRSRWYGARTSWLSDCHSVNGIRSLTSSNSGRTSHNTLDRRMARPRAVAQDPTLPSRRSRAADAGPRRPGRRVANFPPALW